MLHAHGLPGGHHSGEPVPADVHVRRAPGRLPHLQGRPACPWPVPGRGTGACGWAASPWAGGDGPPLAPTLPSLLAPAHCPCVQIEDCDTGFWEEKKSLYYSWVNPEEMGDTTQTCLLDPGSGPGCKEFGDRGAEVLAAGFHGRSVELGPSGEGLQHQSSWTAAPWLLRGIGVTASILSGPGASGVERGLLSPVRASAAGLWFGLLSLKSGCLVRNRVRRTALSWLCGRTSHL